MVCAVDLELPNPHWFDAVFVLIELEGSRVFLDPAERGRVIAEVAKVLLEGLVGELQGRGHQAAGLHAGIGAEDHAVAVLDDDLTATAQAAVDDRWVHIVDAVEGAIASLQI